jgi:putative intracellular protease/amidase
MKKNKILVVLTNEDSFGDDPEKTGLWLTEATEFIEEVEKNGFEVDYVSPKGGKVPIDPRSLEEDNMNEYAKEKMDDEEFSDRALTNSLKPSDINPSDYDAIYYTGGHGVVFDFPDNEDLQKISMEIYKDGGYVTSVCHGIAGLLNIKEDSGDYLIKGKQVTGFTQKEEELSGKESKVPFGTEEEAIKRGADFKKEDPFTSFAVKDGQLITGQNPASGKAVAEKLIKALEDK